MATPIERTEPMKVHKNLVLKFLRDHPDEFRTVVGPGYQGTIEEYTSALESATGQWFNGNTLEEES